MWILPLVGYIGVTVGFCFLTLAIGVNNPISEERSDANEEPLSLRPLLPLRARRRAHRPLQETPHPSDIRRNRTPSATMRSRRLPARPVGAEHHQPRRVPTEPTPVPSS